MEGHHIVANGFKLWYVESGSGTPVVYVHGNTGSHLWFDRVMDLPGASTYALDLPNFGRSNPVGDARSIDVYGDAIGAFIDALEIERPVLVGHSLGGAAAMALAVHRPRLLRGLVLVDSAAPTGLVTPKAHLPLLEAMAGDRALLTQALKGVAPTMDDEAFLSRLVDDALLMAKPAWTGHALALESFNYAGRCQAFPGPTLVVWGRKDAIISEAMARQTAAAFPGARLEILEKVGHSVIVEDPQSFKGILGAFLKTCR